MYDVAESIVKLGNMTGPTVIFNDFGGVSAYHLQDGEKYKVDDPNIIKGTITAWIFSFVPTNKKFAEIELMKSSAINAGFKGIIIVTKKEGSRGKADTMNALVRYIPDTTEIVYYEDTASVLDTVSNRVKKMWVQPPTGSGFEDMIPTNLNVKTLSINQYLKEMLE